MLDFLFLPCRRAFTRPKGLVFTCKSQGGKEGTNARRKLTALPELRLAASRPPYLRTGKTTAVDSQCVSLPGEDILRWSGKYNRTAEAGITAFSKVVKV